MLALQVARKITLKRIVSTSHLLQEFTILSTPANILLILNQQNFISYVPQVQ